MEADKTATPQEDEPAGPAGKGHLIHIRRCFYSLPEDEEDHAASERMLQKVRDEIPVENPQDPIEVLTALLFKINDLGGAISIRTDMWVGVFVTTETHRICIVCDRLEYGLAGAYLTLKGLAAAAGGKGGGQGPA